MGKFTLNAHNGTEVFELTHRPSTEELRAWELAVGLLLTPRGSAGPQKGSAGEGGQDERSGEQSVERSGERSAIQPLEILKTGQLPKYGLAHDFVELYQGKTETPSAFLYFGFLTCLGAAIASTTRLNDLNGTEPRLFTLCLGPSSDSRKSTVLAQCQAFFEGVEPFRSNAHFCRGVGSGEGLLNVFNQQSHDVILAYDEFKSLVQKAGIEGSSLLAMICTLFENHDLENVIKTKATRVTGARLSMIAASTLATYETLFNKEFLAMGFVNRLWLVVDHPDVSIPVTASVDAEALRMLRLKTESTINRYSKPHLLSFSREALETWSAWYHNRPRGDAAKRLEGYGVRLMVLLAVDHGETEITKDIVEETLLCLNNQYDLRQFYDPIDALTLSARMEEKIRRVLKAKGPLALGELKQYCNAQKSGMDYFLRALSTLEAAQELKKEWVTNERGRYLSSALYTLLEAEVCPSL